MNLESVPVLTVLFTRHGHYLASQAEVAAAEGALKKLGGTLLGVDLVQSYSQEGQRTAVVVRKNGPTPQKYPRVAGTPNKNPL
jgi:16S rRNA (guanine527-N7)-methyltransferase